MPSGAAPSRRLASAIVDMPMRRRIDGSECSDDLDVLLGDVWGALTARPSSSAWAASATGAEQHSEVDSESDTEDGFEALACPCGAGPCLERTAAKLDGTYRRFLRCPLNHVGAMGAGCGFFLWLDPAREDDDESECSDDESVCSDDSDAYVGGKHEKPSAIGAGQEKEDGQHGSFHASVDALVTPSRPIVADSATDCGDLVGDDPSNPATITDKVGDNVGSIAGMGTDASGSSVESTWVAFGLLIMGLVSWGSKSLKMGIAAAMAVWTGTLGWKRWQQLRRPRIEATELTAATVPAKNVTGLEAPFGSLRAGGYELLGNQVFVNGEGEGEDVAMILRANADGKQWQQQLQGTADEPCDTLKGPAVADGEAAVTAADRGQSEAVASAPAMLRKSDIEESYERSWTEGVPLPALDVVEQAVQRRQLFGPGLAIVTIASRLVLLISCAAALQWNFVWCITSAEITLGSGSLLKSFGEPFMVHFSTDAALLGQDRLFAAPTARYVPGEVGAHAVSDRSHDAVILGAGGAGLRAATGLVGHGINGALASTTEDHLRRHACAIVKGADWLGDQGAIQHMHRLAPEVILDLESFGLPQSRRPEGQVYQRAIGSQWLKLGKGGQAHRREATASRTGHATLRTLSDAALKFGGLFFVEYFAMDREVVLFHPTGIVPAGCLLAKGCRGEGGVLRIGAEEPCVVCCTLTAEDPSSRDVASRASSLALPLATRDGRGVGHDQDYVFLLLYHLPPESWIVTSEGGDGLRAAVGPAGHGTLAHMTADDWHWPAYDAAKGAVWLGDQATLQLMSRASWAVVAGGRSLAVGDVAYGSLDALSGEAGAGWAGNPFGRGEPPWLLKPRVLNRSPRLSWHQFVRYDSSSSPCGRFRLGRLRHLAAATFAVMACGQDLFEDLFEGAAVLPAMPAAQLDGAEVTPAAPTFADDIGLKYPQTSV